MGGVGESIAAVLFSLVGGVMNSTWPLFCKPESPKLIRIATIDGWQWENVWLMFILWSSTLNAILCLSVVGPSTVAEVYRQASTADLSLVCVFAFLWGSGTMCFSLGIQLLGAGPGTALVMSLLVVIGTLLPLIEDHADDAASPAALVTIVGLLFAISGFVTSAQSSRIKARAIEASQQEQAKVIDAKKVELGLPSSDTGTSTVQMDKSGTFGPYNVPVVDKTAQDESVQATKAMGAGGSSDQGNGTQNGTRSAMHASSQAGPPSGLPQKTCEGKEEKTPRGGGHLTAIAVCVAGAVMSSMLQFSFVYGEPLITQAEDEEGVSGAAAPLVVWLLAFSLGGVWNIVYAAVLLFNNATWGRYAWTGWADLCRNFIKVTVMSVFFVGHIHLYGVSQYLFGGLGPVVAWPLIMSSTVLSGQLWSIFMKEWVGVPKLAKSISILSIFLLVTAVTIIAIAGAVL